MKALNARLVRSLNLGAMVTVADNSGARIARIVSVKRGKGVHGRQNAAGISDWVKVSVRAGLPEMKGVVFDAIVVRQKKSYRRWTGERICFYDNAVVLLKDEKGNPKGTMIKGPVAREVSERWPAVSKLAKVVA
ncbi:MAG: uL14 family ribosomal protein [archaeon]